MRTVRLIAKRTRARGSLLLSLFSVAAITVFLLAGMAGYLSGTADTAVREALSQGAATTISVQLNTRLAEDSVTQADEVGQLLSDAFADVRVAVHRTVHSDPLAATVGDRSAPVILAADPNLAQHADLMAGAWPEPDAPAAAVQATAAAELGIEIGDILTIEGERFVVAATWHPRDPASPYWFADPAVASGFDGLSVGPVVIAETALAELSARSNAQWTVVPTGPTLTAEALPQLAGALSDLAGRVDQTSGKQSLELRGSLADRVHSVQRGLGVASALAAVPAVLVALIALIAVAQLARLLVSVRRTETSLLRARGASVTQLTVTSAGEAVAVILPGSAFGAALAAGLLAAGLIPLNVAAMLGAVWPVALAATIGAVLICGAAGWHGARGAASATHGDSGRIRATVTGGVAAIVVVAAGVSVWQFKLYGSPLVAGPDGGLWVDPLTVAAPALLLLALAILAIVAFAPIASLLERWAVVGRGILPVLPGRQVARRVPVFGVALLLITLAVSGTTLTAAYSHTESAATDASARLGNGADVRVQLDLPATVEGPASLVTSVPYLRLPGVADAATVLNTSARIADDTAGLTALAAARMPAVMASVPGSIDPDELAVSLHAERTGLSLGGADELPLTVRVTHAPGGAGQIETFSWLEDADGSIARVSHGVTTVASLLAQPVTLSATVPEGRAGDWMLLAVETTLTAAQGSPGIGITVEGLGETFALAPSSTDPSDRAITYRAPDTLPVVVNEALASRLSLMDGAPVTLRLPTTASPVDAIVVGSTPAIPAATGRLGLIADLPTLNRYLLAGSERIPQAGEVWISGPASAGVADAAVAVSRSSATVTTAATESGERLIRPAIVVLWWGAAGSLLLAVIAVLAITSTFSRDRRDEVVVLRALGMSSASQGKNRMVEIAGIAAAGLVAGIGSGWITAAVTVNELAATASMAAVPTALSFDVLGWVALLFALIAALVTILTSYAGTVSRQARDTDYRGETR